MRTGSLRHYRLLALLVGALVLATLGCTDPAPRPTATPPPSASPTMEPTSTVDPDAIVLSWTREGGIAGFCDGLTLTAGHLADLGTCEDTGLARPDGDLMPTEAIREFEAWRGEFASFEVEWADGSEIADGMTVRLSFIGRGTQVADEDTQRLISDFASRLFFEIAASGPRVQADTPPG